MRGGGEQYRGNYAVTVTVVKKQNDTRTDALSQKVSFAAADDCPPAALGRTIFTRVRRTIYKR